MLCDALIPLLAQWSDSATFSVLILVKFGSMSIEKFRENIKIYWIVLKIYLRYTRKNTNIFLGRSGLLIQTLWESWGGWYIHCREESDDIWWNGTDKVELHSTWKLQSVIDIYGVTWRIFVDHNFKEMLMNNDLDTNYHHHLMVCIAILSFTVGLSWRNIGIAWLAKQRNRLAFTSQWGELM